MTERNDVPANELLRALSDEIAEMSRMSETIQTLVVIACANLSQGDALYKDAQICDLLTQKLSASAGFLASIAKHVPRDWTINVSEATRDIGLSELALAYSLKRPIENADSDGNVELFEQA